MGVLLVVEEVDWKVNPYDALMRVFPITNLQDIDADLDAPPDKRQCTEDDKHNVHDEFEFDDLIDSDDM